MPDTPGTGGSALCPGALRAPPGALRALGTADAAMPPQAAFAHIRGAGHGCVADARVRAHSAEQVRRDALPAAHARGRRVRPALPARGPARARPVRPARGPVLHAQGPARGPAALRPCRVTRRPLAEVGAVFAGSARASAPRALRPCVASNCHTNLLCRVSAPLRSSHLRVLRRPPPSPRRRSGSASQRSVLFSRSAVRALRLSRET
jgi:hypothetical protein